MADPDFKPAFVVRAMPEKTSVVRRRLDLYSVGGEWIGTIIGYAETADSLDVDVTVRMPRFRLTTSDPAA